MDDSMCAAQPQDQSVVMGGTAAFSVAASGTAPFSYQWRFNGADVAGATGASLGLSNVQSNDAGAYSVVISNSAGSVTSGTAMLIVTAPTVAPTILSQPLSQMVGVGGDATFRVVASGTGPMSYQWQVNGADIAGATSDTLTLSNAVIGLAGNYSVVVANVAGLVTSDTALLNVQAVMSGRYNGLFYEEAVAVFSHAGLFTATVNAAGKLKGLLQIGSTKYPFTGQFDATNGTAGAVATCRGQIPLALELQFGVTNQTGQITGTVSDGSWTAQLMAD